MLACACASRCESLQCLCAVALCITLCPLRYFRASTVPTAMLPCKHCARCDASVQAQCLVRCLRALAMRITTPSAMLAPVCALVRIAMLTELCGWQRL